MATWDEGPGSIGSMNVDDDIYYDPRTGQYYGHYREAWYNSRGKGGKYFTEVAALSPWELEQFKKYNKKGVRIFGGKGRDAYQGPGRLVGTPDAGFDSGSGTGVPAGEPVFQQDNSSSPNPFSRGKKDRGYRLRKDGSADDEFIGEIIDRADWWDTERVGGQRGNRRKAMMSSRQNAVQAFRDAFYGNDWGGK